MKLIIQIICYNEADTLATTIKLLPRQVEGFEKVEFLIIDDGSTDSTADVAIQFGVDHINRIQHSIGLNRAFSLGLDASLKMGADVILNTNAHNQYKVEDIPRLVAPIVNGDAELVIGDRDVSKLKYFSNLKQKFHLFGSWVVSQPAGIFIPDATCGFRAMSREVALQTMVFSEYSYFLETLIQAGNRKFRITHISITPNPPERPWRVIRDIIKYFFHSSITIMRAYVMYRAIRIFFTIGGILLGISFVISGRLFIYWMMGNSGGHVQSLLLAAVLSVVGFQIILFGLLADLVGLNRKVEEEILYRSRKRELTFQAQTISLQ